MEDYIYVRKLIKIAKPSLALQYSLLEEARIMADLDREQKRITKTTNRKLEQREKKSIVAGIDAIKRQDFVEKAERQQLEEETDELKQLHHYLAMARNSKALVAQLKAEDIAIDRRYEMVRQERQAAKEHYRLREEQQAKENEEKQRRANEHRFDLQAQLKANEARRLDDRAEYLRYGEEARQRQKEADKQHQKELEAKAIAKLKTFEVALAMQRERIEAKKLEKADDKHIYREALKMQEKSDVITKGLVDARNHRIRRQQEISQKIGEKVLAIKNAKEQKLENIIDGFIVDLKYRTDLLYEKEQEKANELRALMQHNIATQKKEMQMEAEYKLRRTNENMVKRLESTHHISEMNLLSKRIEREKKDIENFFMMKAMDLEDRKAENKLLSNFGSPAETELRVQRHIKTVRGKILQEQPISVLRYLPASVVRSDYLPEPLGEQVRQQVLRDPIPVFNIKRNLRHVKRMKDEGGYQAICCKTCPPPELASNYF